MTNMHILWWWNISDQYSAVTRIVKKNAKSALFHATALYIFKHIYTEITNMTLVLPVECEYI